jgi:phage/plasmid-associated DNA primase
VGKGNKGMNENKIIQQPSKISKKEVLIRQMAVKNRIIRFKGGAYADSSTPYKWESLDADSFARRAYTTLGPGVDKSRIRDVEHYFMVASPDHSHLARYIAIGSEVWDRQKLEFTDDVANEDCVYRSIYPAKKGNLHKQFILDLACDDKGVADDIMQAIAPIFMDKKPTGVIWFLGGGANGKSSLISLVYRIFGNFLSDLTLTQIEDERDAPALNGKIANICPESSDAPIRDVRTYKAISTHEPFSVHKFNSQEMVKIDRDLHYIFNTNKIPTFSDKGHSTRRRTLVVPFNNRFELDETFEERTFTDEFISNFIYDLLEHTKVIRDNGYKYQWSSTTELAKTKYDTEANTAESYFDELGQLEIVGFTNFRHLKDDYDNWCDEAGHQALGKKTLAKVADERGFARKTIRVGDQISNYYMLKGYEFEEMKSLGGMRLGLFQKKDSSQEIAPVGDDNQEALKLLQEW